MEQPQKYQDEIDWKDLRRKPEKLFGYSYVYVLIVIAIIGLLYISNITTVGKNAVDPGTPDSSAMVTDLPLRRPQVIPPVDVKVAGVSSADLVAKGRDLYAVNCVSCHGATGLGDGPTAPTLNPKPRNFHSLQGWVNGSKVSQMYKTLQEGITGSAMASYNYLPPADRFALIHYVRTFAPGQPQDTPAELQQLDVTYQLSRGMNVAGQIPVRKAEQLIIREHQPEVAALEALVARTRTDRSPEAELFRQVARRPLRAIVTLQQAGRLTSLDDFIKAVSASPVQDGFRADVDRLSAAEWATLHRFASALPK